MAHCGWAGVAFGKGIASDAAMRHKGDRTFALPKECAALALFGDPIKQMPVAAKATTGI